ncbi:hypothetical protein SAMN05443144_116101 [Fodinibius roseus]|uniref:Uncharacterized protein n=1 Tax=Fodinibius roseus TaxID=1194090 RepID=A0A1M5G6L9_9BACT|nr:hypothetical protein SAMN05443144_116101 [Fodinibius roseus]
MYKAEAKTTGNKALINNFTKLPAVELTNKQGEVCALTRLLPNSFPTVIIYALTFFLSDDSRTIS